MGAAAFKSALIALACAGCASVAPDTATLDGTRWRVISINSHATPGGERYHIRFDGDRIGAMFGCNGLGGRYRVEGTMLVASEVNQTLMGCMEPAMTFERWASAVLTKPMQMQWTSARRLVLSNGAGSVELERLP